MHYLQTFLRAESPPHISLGRSRRFASSWHNIAFLALEMQIFADGSEGRKPASYLGRSRRFASSWHNIALLALEMQILADGSERRKPASYQPGAKPALRLELA